MPKRSFSIPSLREYGRLDEIVHVCPNPSNGNPQGNPTAHGGKPPNVSCDAYQIQGSDGS